MKKNPMFLLPIILIVLIGSYLGYKWWKARTLPLPIQQISETAAVDDRGQSLLKSFNLTDKNATQLKPTQEGSKDFGVVRISEDKKLLTIVGSFAAPANYQAWMTVDGKTAKIGLLRLEKGGYVLDYKAKTLLPTTFTIIVSKESKNDAVMEEKLLEGTVQTQ